MNVRRTLIGLLLSHVLLPLQPAGAQSPSAERAVVGAVYAGPLTPRLMRHGVDLGRKPDTTARSDWSPLPRRELRPTDAWLHAGSSASIQFMGYGGLRSLSVRQRDALITSVGVALLAGIGKELHDRKGHGDPSARDLFWDVVGIGVGVGLSRFADR